ncbi:hypothetical protein [Candidatus Poriferisodalis sp.]|uniref:hypothetical protein n=1 Tax=Candidatus Poriferisodalis sp. TaxID=3101277 RepID=UPI003B01AB77
MPLTSPWFPTPAPVSEEPPFTYLDGDYAWLNSIQAVGIGSFPEGGLVYEVYELL